MLPTLSETAVVLSALARIARRAARLEASAPTTSASSDFHARFNAPHAADRFRSARPWPSALADARVHKGFTGAVTLKTPVSRPDDYEEELLSEVDQYNEYILTGLRTSWGVDADRLKEPYRQYFLDKIYNYIGDFVEKKEKAVYSLTPKGRLLADRISSDLFY